MDGAHRQQAGGENPPEHDTGDVTGAEKNPFPPHWRFPGRDNASRFFTGKTGATRPRTSSWVTIGRWVDTEADSISHNQEIVPIIARFHCAISPTIDFPAVSCEPANNEVEVVRRVRNDRTGAPRSSGSERRVVQPSPSDQSFWRPKLASISRINRNASRLS